MRKLVVIFILFMLSNLGLDCLYAQEVQFTQANQAYSEGNYEQAVTLYTEALQLGDSSLSVWYNLGNAYYKLDNIPEAIWHYEKALKLNASDKDVLYNLTIANLRIIDKIEAVPQLFFKKWWDDFKGMCTACLWSKIALLFAWFSLGALVWYLFVNINFAKRIVRWKSIAFAFISFCCIGLALLQFQTENSLTYGLMFSEVAYIKSAPNNAGTDLFILHEGVKFRVLDNVGEWSKIKLIDGKEGWLRNTQYREI